MKQLQAIISAICLCLFTILAQAQTHNDNAGNQQLLQNNTHLMHAIEAKQQACMQTANGATARTTNTTERLIATSNYNGSVDTTALYDSMYFVYSGGRSSTFDFNSMAYQYSSIYQDDDVPMNVNASSNNQAYINTQYSNINNEIRNFGSDVLFDTAWVYYTVLYSTTLNLTHYDANNNPIWLGAGNTESIYDNVYNTFNANQNITSAMEIEGSAGTYDTIEKRSLTYNGNLITSDTINTYSMGAWTLKSAWAYSYDNSGNLISATEYKRIPPVLSSLSPYIGYFFFYNANNTIQKDSIVQYEGSISLSRTTLTDSVGYTAGVNYITYERIRNYELGIVASSSIQTEHITSGLPDTVYNTFYYFTNNQATETGTEVTGYAYDSYNNPILASEYAHNMDNNFSDSSLSVYHYYYQTFNEAVDNVIRRNINITVYPNPATSEINISQTGIQQGAYTHVTLINTLGQAVYSESLAWMAATETVSVASLKPGDYWLVIQDKNGNILSRQTIVKE